MILKNQVRLVLLTILSVLVVILIIMIVNRVRGSRIQLNLSSQAVVTQIQDLDRMETTSYSIEKVIDGGTNYNAIQQFLVGDKILLIAHGIVVAGFDLHSLSAKDVIITGKDIELHLPAPEVLTTTLDNAQTRVYDRQQGLLNRGDKTLETTVRQAAEKSIHDAACKQGILMTASENGRKQFIGLLKAFGFNTITIVIPSGSC